jgi:Trypsin
VTAQRAHASGCLLALVLAGSCGGEAPASDPTAESRSALQNGRPDAEDNGVVGVSTHHDDKLILCTGVLIAPNLVLTARHCVAPSDGSDVVCGETPLGAPYTGDSVLVTEQASFPDDFAAYTEGSETRVPPDGSDICGFDVALVVLKTPLSESRAKPVAPRLDLAPQPNEPYSAVGYGATCPSDDGECSGPAGLRRRVDDLRVTCALCPNANFGTTEWLGDKDLCSGDSGSPALDQQGRVIGVASRAMEDSGNCIAPVYARIDAWHDFLTTTAIDAARTGNYAPAAWTQIPAAPVASGLTAEGGCSLRAPRRPGPLWASFALLFGLFRCVRSRDARRRARRPTRR